MTGARISDMPTKDALTAGAPFYVPGVLGGDTNYKFDLTELLGSLSVGAFAGVGGLSIPAGTDLICTSEFRVGSKKGRAFYRATPQANPAADLAYAAAHPGWTVLTANGRLFSLDEEQHITFDMFGAYGDFVAGASGTDDYPQWLLAKDYINTLKLTLVNSYYKAVPALHFGRAAYYFTQSLDLTDGIYQLIGYGPNSHGFGYGTLLVFVAGVSGILVQSWSTTGVTGTTSNTPKGGTSSIIQDVGLLSKGGTIGAEQHGVVMRGSAILNRVYVENFGGNGFKISAAAPDNGNANLWRMYDCTGSHNGRAGLYIDGPDVNAGISIGFDGSANGTYGIYDSSFLGNQHIGFHLATNGTVAQAGPDWAPSRPGGQVHRTGNLYIVVKGQEAGASTNAPTGAATSNAWWDWIAPGSPTAVYAEWVSGTTYLHGGAVLCDDPAAKSLFNGYCESDQAPGHVNARSLSVGGFQGITGPSVNGLDGYVNVNAIFASQWLTSGYLNTYFGGIDNVSGIVFQVGHTSLLSDSFRLKFNGTDLTFDYVGPANTSFGITGPSTTQQFGTGAASPYVFNVPKIAIGGRIMTSGSAAPTTGAHAKGEVVWNDGTNGANNAVDYWRCSVAGTPGTWVARP